MDPVALVHDPPDQVNESSERVSARYAVIGHRQADVLDGSADHQPPRKLCFRLGRLDRDLGGARRRHAMLVVFGDREYPGRPSLLDPFDPSQLVGEDPGERPSGVRLVLVRVPRDGTVIEEEMRFLTQVDEEYSTVLGNLL